MQIALNKTNNDIFRPTGGGLYRVSGGRFVVQQVQSRLKTILGEWILDESIGFIGPSDLDRNFSLIDIELRCMKIILETNGVLSVTSMDLVYKDRKLVINFTAKTKFGEIDTTKPWGDNIDESGQVIDPDLTDIVTHGGIIIVFGTDEVVHTGG